ncbi:MAG TPA: NAD(P)-dependent alcohol dehydrogenase, partial [Cyclobacteriaceae bacterium]
MKSYRIKEFHSINGIRSQQQHDPEPGPEEVVIRVMTASVNRRDAYILNRTYPLPPHENIIPLSDGAGEVTAIGNKVTRFKIGDRVAGNYFPRWRDGRVGMDIMDQLGCTVDGMLCEYAVLHQDWLVLLPDYLTWEEASTLPCAALTAWSALKDLSAGQTVLTMGSGGVSLFAIQFAKARGARLVVLTSRDENAERLMSVGAGLVINYRKNPNWSNEVLRFTKGQGVDLIMETGGTDTIEQSVGAVKMGGEIVVLNPYGSSANQDALQSSRILSAVFLRLIHVHAQY